MTWLRQIPGVREIEFDGETLPRTNDLIIGTGLAASYDPATRKTTLATNASGLPAGTATYQPLTWNGSAWVGAALNLAQAAAVTGVLGVANGGVPVPANPADDAKVLTASGGTYTWAATAATLTAPANPGDNGKVAIASAGNLSYALIATANISATAGIVGTQLSATAAIAGSQLAAAAAIAASQLASGGANTVLQGGTPNTWTATPTVTSLAATYIALGADPADAGAIRLSHAMGVYGESSTPGTDRAVLTWGVAAADTVGLGDAAALTRITGSAVHAYAGATQTAQLGLATGDFVKMGDVPASTGNLRVDDSWTLYQRNGNPGTADRAVLTCLGEGVQLGSTAQTGNTIIDGNLVYIRTAGSVRSLVTTAEWQMTLATLSFAGTLGASNVVHHPPAGDALAGPFTVRAQSAWASASTNKDGAHLLLQGGAEKGAAAGKKGGVRLQLNGTTETMLEATEVAIGRRVVALCRGSDLTTTQMPANTGDGVVYLANAATVPTASPVTGGILYSSGGNLFWMSSAGVSTQLTP